MSFPQLVKRCPDTSLFSNWLLPDRVITATIRIQFATLTRKFRLEVFFAKLRFADSSVLAGLCGGRCLPGTG
jgi:hypothetical protein